MNIHFDNLGCTVLGLLIGFVTGILISDKTDIHIEKRSKD